MCQDLTVSVVKLYVCKVTKGLVTNYGEWGLQNRRGGAREVLLLRKEGAEKILAMLEGVGHNKFWGSFYAVAWSFRHIERGGGGAHKKFPLFKRGYVKKVSDTQFSHFVAPRLSITNDQSLKWDIKFIERHRSWRLAVYCSLQWNIFLIFTRNNVNCKYLGVLMYYEYIILCFIMWHFLNV